MAEKSIKKRIAVLIDAENVSPDYIEAIFDEISASGGMPNYKRIYGNFLSRQLRGWNEIANQYSLYQVQQQNFTKGKNSSDSVLIIDAMDILHSHTVDGICIVSSDSDFTRLAMRVVESGLDVIGMGEEKTADSFINACTEFKYLENLGRNGGEGENDGLKESDEADGIDVADTVDENKPKGKSTGNSGNAAVVTKPVKAPKRVITTIKTAIVENADDDGWTHIGPVGSALKSRYPDFDPRRWGSSSKQLSAFLIRLEEFEVIARGTDAKKAYYIRIKENR
jgi:uncharacterized LabA/DUF88 family protein